MSFISVEFILFFIITFAIYYTIPKKYRYIILAIASYGIYIFWDAKYVLLLFLITVITYGGGFLLQTRHKKVSAVLLLGCIVGLLLFYRFGTFGINVLKNWGIITSSNQQSLVIPIGFSFYTLQTMGYLIDVYKGKIPPEKNIIKYSLFISFFLTIVSGPIERTHNLLKQIQKGTDFSYEKAKKGILLLVYGCFQKIIIADRIGPLVNHSFSTYEEQTGATLLVAVVLYGIQIYTDFAGYSNIAVGAGNLLGFDLIVNFRQPYFACDIKEFWKRWHISLSTWLKDYIYIPLGGSRRGKYTTYRNLMLTFIVSGIWHGTGINYIIWGCLHGGYQLIGKVSENYRIRFKKILRIKEDCFSYQLWQRIITFSLVDFAWLFFGASGTMAALRIIKRIILEFQIGNTLSWKSYLLGMQEKRFIMLIMAIAIVVLVDWLHEKKISIIDWLNKQNLAFRWIVYFVVVMNLLVGIIYNYGTETSGFIYTRF